MALRKHGIEDLTNFATDFIHQCGESALSYYGKGKSFVKFDEGLVTEAELHLTDLFRDHLHSTFPEHQIFSENREDNPDYTHEEKRYLWIYDPLDGVANFQAGIPIWGISLALFENFWPIFGVFYMPATGDVFKAMAGGKAYRGESEIHISAQETINDESLLLTYSRFHQHYNPSFPGKIRNMGCTAAHICYVATGRAEAAIIANESYEDIAAAWMIIEAAGGKIYNLKGKEFFFGEYLEGHREADHLLVAAPETYSQVRDTLQRVSE